MYKVFVNEKKLSLSQYPDQTERKLRYEGFASIEMALDLLENTSCPELNVYAENIDELWEDFSHMFKIIEAAGGVIENKQKEILFIKRLGKWDLPKGKIEKNESLEEAALREIKEETGLKTLILEKFIDNTFHIYTERDGKKVLKTTYWFYVTFVGNEEPVPQTEEGITAIEWKNIDQIHQTVIGHTFKNIEVILNEFWNFS